ncbi:DUF1641 domain-containing protein [Superficieibacter sp. 1612_C1]|uniref:DUF1641 domain-containing protein n=1 Tax=Superficieibacter sp. 1612_C1 TaxID=2780382 RepID=UPI0018844F2E|nr:DUF1641 domain-containing protein [Superficieibacter sp. 1612_C1]
MAERMNYEVPPAQTQPSAGDALSDLLENLHHHGFLRLANDMVKANTQIAKIVVDGLNQPGTQTGVQNLSLLLVALSKIPPEQFNHLLMALTRGVQAMTEKHDAPEKKSAAPGVTGFIKMLGDEDTWQKAAPFFNAVQAFSSALQEEPDKPITRYSGKSSNA